ncbi:hypothetical protein CAEBREN_21264 [Caenorhabditis brenneri]|uniref:DUF38 domain-containing protein n=1 Tax=Caenorhabditis brenneri TaxID=135651 RepID=G0NJB7_CAEBE|nr:hypothetical protein CAEBREN_21264 [Caenorhabditis brenneri]
MNVNTEDEEHDIQYEQQAANCEVTFDDTSKIIENEDFTSMAANDLGLVLKHQKSEMGSFALQFPRHPDRRAECMDTYEGRFLTGLEPFLRSRKTPLSTFEFVMRGTNQQSILLKVLPYLNPEYLNRIEITTTKNTEKEPSPILKMNEIVELDQWKKAKELYISMLKLDVPLENFYHFSKAEFEIQSVSAKELTELKERILKDKKFEDFKIEYHQLKDKKKLLKFFGRPFEGSTSAKRIWYHKFPIQKKKALYIAWREKEKVFKFYSISMQNVPDNAF